MPVFDKPYKGKGGDVRQKSRIQLWKSEGMATDLIATSRITCIVTMGIDVRVACVIRDHHMAMPVVTIGGHRECFASRNDCRPEHDGRNNHGYEAVHSHAKNVCQNLSIGNTGRVNGPQRLIVHHKNRLRKCEPDTPFGLLRVAWLSK
jgi:hypothetical protein